MLSLAACLVGHRHGLRPSAWVQACCHVCTNLTSQGKAGRGNAHRAACLGTNTSSCTCLPCARVPPHTGQGNQEQEQCLQSCPSATFMGLMLCTEILLLHHFLCRRVVQGRGAPCRVEGEGDKDFERLGVDAEVWASPRDLHDAHICTHMHMCIECVVCRDRTGACLLVSVGCFSY